MELLRIISMLMVLVVHADGAALGLPQHPSLAGGARDLWRLGVEATVIIGVNCFTLISGYFGIRLRVRTLLAYLFQCLFYTVAIATFAWIYNPAKYSSVHWFESWLVLTHTDLWYVPAYFLLMLLSPVINSGMAQLSRRQNLIIIILLVAFSLWGGWMWSGQFNPTGYTIMQLVMIYMIGRLISLYPLPSSRKCLIWIVLYLLSLTGVLFSAFLLPTAKAFAYNSPAVLIMSVSFFYCFLRIRLKSSLVNYLAKSAFAVYLVHKAPVIWGDFLKPFLIKEWQDLSLTEYSALVLVGAIAIYLIVIVPDIIRRKLSDALLLLLANKIQIRRNQISK